MDTDLPDGLDAASPSPDPCLAPQRAYHEPTLEDVGSVPRLTGGSDFFGDND